MRARAHPLLADTRVLNCFSRDYRWSYEGPGSSCKSRTIFNRFGQPGKAGSSCIRCRCWDPGLLPGRRHDCICQASKVDFGIDVREILNKLTVEFSVCRKTLGDLAFQFFSPPNPQIHLHCGSDEHTPVHRELVDGAFRFLEKWRRKIDDNLPGLFSGGGSRRSAFPLFGRGLRSHLSIFIGS
jgi:hypothetical protein